MFPGGPGKHAVRTRLLTPVAGWSPCSVCGAQLRPSASGGEKRHCHGELLQEYRDGRRAVEDIVGKEVPLFRPPMGHIGLKSVIAIRLARVRPWMWNCDPGDWRPGVSRDEIVRAVGAAKPDTVVLLHDGSSCRWQPGLLIGARPFAAVRMVIKAADLHGLRFTALPASGVYGNSREPRRYIR